MKLCLLLTFNFFVFLSLSGQTSERLPPFSQSPQRQPQQQQPTHPAPYEPHPYDRHPYEPHPYELQPYEPHLYNVSPEEKTEPRLNQPQMFDPEEIAREKRGSSYTAANAQAIYWLNLIDQRQYVPSWLEAGMLLRDLITKEQWAAAMEATRQEWGNVTSRKASTHQLIQTLPNGSRGNFMIIKYRTNFSEKYGAVETLILAAEGPLQLWKVISYKVGKR